MDLIGGADGDSNTNIGYITIDSSQFKLAHNNTNISGELDLGFSRVSCNDLDVLNKTTTYDLEVKHELINLLSATFNELNTYDANINNDAIINNKLHVINNAIINELDVSTNVTSSNIKCNNLEATQSAILPKINSRP